MQIDGVNVQVQPELAERARSENLTAALLAALLGAFLIWGVGF
jgi:cobalt transporter subunit CbtB